ncbi:DUF3795 domain-containing protein [Geomesophilobacter sediminis]|uniref:DUF3795 domain-containing protein n=1 Tax=Geomesophilobacter sediminis TaxID=2798584 RepID=A0A8J7M0F5_9BACT|nr:DUF3795 domain-containing protein [Geomesophilobacter sediminis]MBJ6724917.1 DUF3795 domain-containing protein [Geomesophilobacter sediminis]
MRQPAAIFSSDMIAPCGLNCGVCRAFNRESNRCPGCRGDDAGKPPTRCSCPIKNCSSRGPGSDNCSGCVDFPCPPLQRLDRRYRKRYGVSCIDNLAAIRDAGLAAFLAGEAARWSCAGCGGLLSMHEAQCPSCGADRR